MKSRAACKRHYPPMHGNDKPFDPRPWLHYPRILVWGAQYCQGSGLPNSSCWIVWDKREELRRNKLGDLELAWTNFPGPPHLHRQLWNGFCRRGELPTPFGRERFHPTQKPVRLMLACLQFSNTSGLILDPFIGSDSSLVAARLLKRKAVGIEIEKAYCEQAATWLDWLEEEGIAEYCEEFDL